MDEIGKNVPKHKKKTFSFCQPYVRWFWPIGSPRWSRNCKRKTHSCWARWCCWFRFNHLCFWTSSWRWRSCWNWKNWNCRSRRTRSQWFPQEKKINHYCFNGCWLFHPFCSICTYLKQSIMHLFKTRQKKELEENLDKCFINSDSTWIGKCLQYLKSKNHQKTTKK